MNNFEQDERAKDLVAKYQGNAYNLARRIVELEEKLNKLIGLKGKVTVTVEVSEEGDLEITSDGPHLTLPTRGINIG